MNEEPSNEHPSTTYTPGPEVPPELAPRFAVILAVLSGEKSVSEAAREMNLSRNHFQSILHRSLAAMITELAPKERGRPAKPPAMSELAQRVKRLERENTRLKRQVEATHELITVAGELLHGQRSPGQRRARRSDAGADDDEEPEPRARLLAAVDRMHALGLTLARACWLAGRDTATIRRWRGRTFQRERHTSQPTCAAREKAETLVRSLNGLIGAAALSHGIEGLSRRVAARIKAGTLTALERERKAVLTQVTVNAAGVVRGIDAMYVVNGDKPHYLLIAADAATPYRTSVAVSARYDTALVMHLLKADIDQHGAPLVLRADRARAHDTPEVRSILKQHQVLMLHGPARYPCFYGQLERQNREHRAWLAAAADPAGASMEQLLERMIWCLNTLWPRRKLGWQTAADVWRNRPPISAETRTRFLEEVKERTQKLACRLNVRGVASDLIERLAIEQTLTHIGYLQLQSRSRC
jgi:transposase InsO family protein